MPRRKKNSQIRLKPNLYMVQRAEGPVFRVRIKTPSGRFDESFPELEQAERRLAEIRADSLQRRAGHRGLIIERETLGQVVTNYLAHRALEVESKTLRPSSLKTITYHLRPVLIWAEADGRLDLPADRLNDTDILRFIAWRRAVNFGPRKASDDTIRQSLGWLGAAYKLAGRRSDLRRRWAAPRGLGSAGHKRILPVRQWFALLDQLPAGSAARTAAEYAFLSGARPSDWARLRWNQIDWHRGTVTWRIAKLQARPPHTIALTRPMQRHLLAWRQSQERAELLQHPDYWADATLRDQVFIYLYDGQLRPYQSHSLTNHLRRASKAAGIDPPVGRFGLARNHHIDYSLKAGRRVADVVDQVGHSSFDLILKYKRGGATDLCNVDDRKLICKRMGIDRQGFWAAAVPEAAEIR